MIFPHDYAGRRIAFLGLGRSGLAAAQALMAGGAEAVGWDDLPDARHHADLAGLTIADPDSDSWKSAGVLSPGPGVPLTHPAIRAARKAGLPITGDMQFFQDALNAAAVPAIFVAVTGTNGKSTTTALIAHILRAGGRDVEMGGNIGVPVLSLRPPHDGMIYVLEVSSFQIETAPGLAPDVAVHLNLSPDHLDRHGSLEDYAAIKARLFSRQKKGSTAVIGVDDPHGKSLCAALKKRPGLTVVPVSSDRGESIADVPAAGNRQNAAAAIAVARALKIPEEVIAGSLKGFSGLPHRMESIAESGGVRFINDSKATNAAAALQALKSFDTIHWILGGVAKPGGITTLTDHLTGVAHAYLIGEAADDFAAVLEGHVSISRHDDLQQAVSAAATNAFAHGGKNPVVLLSPACASFDQFANFEERGDAFRRAVDSVIRQRGAS